MTELEKLGKLKVGDQVRVKPTKENPWCLRHAGEVFTITGIRIECQNGTCNEGQCTKYDVQLECTKYDVQLEGVSRTKCLSTRWFKAVQAQKKLRRKRSRMEDLIL